MKADTGSLDGSHRSVVVVGGGQAGLSISRHLTDRKVDHLVLERHRVGHEWRERRWDSFCLVTPNWQCQLPGFPYPGADPDGFMVRSEIVAYLEAYARSFDPPLLEGVSVDGLRRGPDGRFALQTSRGGLTADQVVLAVGPYQQPAIPRLAERLPSALTQLHSSQYRNPEQLPAGAVLVVGTGQSGCQIAEDLHLAGRQVHLSTGTAPRVARFYRGRDVVAWLDAMGYYRKGIDEFDDEDAVRFRANHYVTGRDGGRDLDLRAFARTGMRLYGRLLTVRSHAGGAALSFAPDLASNLDAADAVSESIKNSIDAFIEAEQIDAPAEGRYTPVWHPDDEPDVPRDRLEVTDPSLGSRTGDGIDPGIGEGTDPVIGAGIDPGIGAVIWATGYRRDYSWVELPVFNGRGYPTHRRGVTSQPGLYLLGLPWQHTWGSGRFSGVGADAAYLAEQIAGQIEARVGERQLA